MAKRQTIDATFGPFILSFPCITKPDEKFDVYTANGVGEPNSAEMKQAKEILAAALKSFGLDPKTAKLPLVKEMTKDPNSPANARKPKKIATGKLVLKNKSKRAPAIFDAQGREVNPRGLDIRGGTLARIQGFLSPYDMTQNVRNADGEVEEIDIEGISFTLTGIQIIRMANAGGSKGFDAYEGEEGGWTPSADDLPIGDDADGDDGVDDQAQDDGGVLDI